MSEDKKAKRRAYMKEYRAANPEYKEKERAYDKARYAANRELRMWKRAKERAKAKNIPFTITPSDIAIPSTCPIFGTPLQMSHGHAGPNSPSLDRIVPARGYVPGNVLVVSHRANVIKNDATPEELLIVAAFYQQVLDDSQEP